jgi:hypothetical protein
MDVVELNINRLFDQVNIKAKNLIQKIFTANAVFGVTVDFLTIHRQPRLSISKTISKFT